MTELDLIWATLVVFILGVLYMDAVIQNKLDKLIERTNPPQEKPRATEP